MSLNSNSNNNFNDDFYSNFSSNDEKNDNNANINNQNNQTTYDIYSSFNIDNATSVNKTNITENNFTTYNISENNEVINNDWDKLDNEEFITYKPPKPPKNPGKRKRILFRIASIFIVLLVISTVTVLVLAELKLIKLPWIDYPEVLVLSQNELALKSESKYQFSSYVYPSQVNYGKVIYESSDPSVAEINPITGYVEAKNNGVATVKAYLEDYHDILDTCEIVVSNTDVMVESISVTNENIDMVVGSTYMLKYEYYPKNAGLHYFSYSSSDTSIVKVNNKGEVTAVSEGKAIVNIMDEVSGQTVNQEFTIYKGSGGKNKYIVSSIKVSASEVSLNVGGEYQVSATVYPIEVVQSITWSSLDSNIASVSPDGLITANDYGKTQIIATAIDGTNKIINVSVQEDEIPMTSLQINDTLELYEGESKRINTIIEPKNATDQKIVWAIVDPTIATIDQTGNVTGVMAGNTVAKALASEGNITAQTQITVTKPSNTVNPTDIKLSSASVTINAGSSKNVTATVVPDNATNKALTWTSTDNNIATVSNGMIYGKSPGTAYIDVSTSTGISKRIQVVVNSIAISSIKLSQTSAKIGKGGQIKLYVTFTPSNASNKTIKWVSSDNNIATVDGNGLVTTHNAGRVVIRATSVNGKVSYCNINVTNDTIAVSSISLNSNQYIIKVGEKAPITAIINPHNATNQKVTFASSNPGIATLDSDGKIKGIREGVTEVTATSSNGKTAKAFVIVKNKNATVNYLDGSTIKYWYDNTYKTYAITHIWVRDPYNQFKTEIPDKFGTLANANTLTTKAAKKNPGKTLIAINASSHVSSAFNTELYKLYKAYANTSPSPIVIYDGKLLRDFSIKYNLPFTYVRIYGMNKDGNLIYYTYSQEKDKNTGLANRILNDGVKYTFSWYPVLVINGKMNDHDLTQDNNIRQGICQIDSNNFLYITNISSNRSIGFSRYSLASKMVELGCIRGYNLDGGGSTSIYYVKKGDSSPTKIRVMEGTYGRNIPDIVYFVGD